VPYLVTGSVQKIIAEFGFPLVVFAVNPFCYDGYRIAHNRSALYRAVRSLSMSYKFAVCAQPLKGEMVSFKSVFGTCAMKGEAEQVSMRVYQVFQLPICKLHVQKVGRKAFLCGLQPLKIGEVLPEDLEIVGEEVSRMSRMGEHLVG
jgi:hypothetical protein